MAVTIEYHFYRDGEHVETRPAGLPSEVLTQFATYNAQQAAGPNPGVECDLYFVVRRNGEIVERDIMAKLTLYKPPGA